MTRLALAALLLSTFAHADDEELQVEPEAAQPAAPVKDPKVAKKWLDAAKQLVQKGDAATRQKKPDEAKTFYDNAITAYEKAIEASTDPNLHFDLAVVAEKAGYLDRAATAYRTLVKTTGARADLVKKATARFDDLTTKTGLLMIISKPEGATITDGGAQLGTTPLADALVLVPGTHTLAIAADGHLTKELELKIEAGSESERTITLDPGTQEPPPPKPTPVEPAKPAPIVEAPPAGPDKLPLYIGAGAAGGFALVATITGIMAVSKHGTFEDENASPGTRADAKDAGKTLALVTDICLVGAIAAGGFTAYWYFRKYKPAQRKMETKTAVLPWVKPDAGGFALAGSF